MSRKKHTEPANDQSFGPLFSSEVIEWAKETDHVSERGVAGNDVSETERDPEMGKSMGGDGRSALPPDPPLGLYRLHWKTGDSSLASVGQDAVGDRWYAPINWISVPGWAWAIIERAELIVPSRPGDE